MGRVALGGEKGEISTLNRQQIFCMNAFENGGTVLLVIDSNSRRGRGRAVRQRPRYTRETLQSDNRIDTDHV